MRAFISGQVGVDKTPFLEAVKDRDLHRGLDLEVCHVGKMMYDEAPDVPAGRNPQSAHHPAQRAAARRLQGNSAHRRPARARDRQHPRHVPLAARPVCRVRFRSDQSVQRRTSTSPSSTTPRPSISALLRDHDLDHSLKDIMVWREEELLATEIIANIMRGYGHFFMLSRGRKTMTIQTIYRLLFEPHKKQGLSQFPHEPCHGSARDAGGDRPLQGGHRRAFHLLRSRRCR